MIEKLTKEQEAKMESYVQKWTAIGLDTARIDPDRARKALDEAYTCAGETPPTELVICASPDDLTKQVLARNPDMSFNDIHFAWGNQEAGWLSFYDFFKNETEVEGLEIVSGLINLAKEVHWCVFGDTEAFVSQKPVEIHTDEQGRLHNEDGAAVLYEDGFAIYAVGGVRLKENIIKRDFTAEDIDKETNQEVRRVMIDLYGDAKYLIDTNAEIVHVDDFGTLIRKEVPGDEAIVMVKVVNSSPEPDGSYKDYYLRVPPHVKFAQEGIAWTFKFNNEGTPNTNEMHWKNYAPLQET